MIKKNQIVYNLITNVLSMGISMLVSLWITPYLIDKLGLAAYGYIGLINNTTNYIYVVTFTLTSMVARFLTVSIEKNGAGEASRVMSSALFTNLFLGGLLIPIIFIIGQNLEKLLNIEGNFVVDVKVAFIVSGIAFIFNSIYSVFSTGAYSKNRLDITNGIHIFANLLRVIFLVLMFSLFSAKIWHYASASIIQTLVILILCVIVFRKLLPDVRFSLGNFDFHLSKELLAAGFFNAIVLLGNNFLTQIDIIVGNRFLPAEVVGMYAAIVLIPNSIRNIGAALSYAFSPTTIKLFSAGNIDELRNYTNKVVKYCGLMVGWPIAIISGLALPILHIWLGKDYSAYQLTILFMLLPLTINQAVNQLYIVQQAMNKVKIPAYAAIIFGVMNIVLAIIFAGPLAMGLFGIVLSGIIMSTLRASVFIPIYTSIITKQSKLAYYKGLVAPVIVTTITALVGLIFQRSFAIHSLLSLFEAAVVLSILYFIVTIFFLDDRERRILPEKLFALLKRQAA